ncbi:flavoprotein [Micromonospora rhizosphaerae]|uniref:flavoprotein n=1 Tax=Micromonospora rhizosphaerae TaxID=568872 RepID=UPI003CCB7DBA
MCGAPLASRAADIAAALVADTWDTTVVGTPASAPWLDVDAVVSVTNRPVRFDYREPSTPKTGPDPEAIVVCPATFNTINKAAAGASDTYALGVLCSALGTRLPTLVVPMINNKLWGHPA